MLAFLGTLFFSLWLVRNQSNELPELRIYTYSGLASGWGAGPELTAEFTKTCHCTVTFVDVKEGGLLLQRLLFERETSQADLVLGLDQARLRYALNHLEFRQVDPNFLREVAPAVDPRLGSWWNMEGRLIAFDWAPLTFITRGLNTLKSRGARAHKSPVFESLKEFFDVVDEPWALPNPRTSTVGLSFLLWLQSESGEDWTNVLKRADIQTLAPNWAQAYALFQKEKFSMGLGYFTSLLFHRREENNKAFEAVRFQQHPIHVEYMGVPKFCKNCQLAESFLKFMLSPVAQRILWQRNYMLPIRLREYEHPELADLTEFNVIAPDVWQKALAGQDLTLEKWDNFAKGFQK